MQREFRIRTRQKRELVDITSQVAEIVRASGVSEGICHVYVAHATAAVVINENDDPNVCLDFLECLDKLVPHGIWRHDRVDNNAAAHIKAAMLGPSESIPIHSGRLLLGTWQAIMLAELDGPRERRVIVTVQ
ncbi:hypothetical protein HRbin30_00209 [bacterium HR30]|nr:hypothetical protein HRbin30_00209 [bacterium HR30]